MVEIVFGGLALIGLFAGWLSQILILGFFFGLLAGVVGFVMFALWILLMVLAYFSPNTIFVGPRNARYV